MTPDPGTRVRTLVDLLTDQGQIVPIDSPAEVIGAKGERLILSIEDPETGERMTAECAVWEVLRRRDR